eukprot:856184-Amphidinium_carterae.1
MHEFGVLKDLEGGSTIHTVGIHSCSGGLFDAQLRLAVTGLMRSKHFAECAGVGYCFKYCMSCIQFCAVASVKLFCARISSRGSMSGHSKEGLQRTLHPGPLGPG